MGKGTCRVSPRVCSELSGAAAVEGWGAGAFGLWDRTWAIPGLGGGDRGDWKRGSGMLGAGSRAKASLLRALNRTCAQPNAGGGGVGQPLFSATPSARHEIYATSPSSAVSQGLLLQAGSSRSRCFRKSSKTLSMRPGAGAGRPVSGRRLAGGLAGPGRARRNADKDPGHGLGNH